MTITTHAVITNFKPWYDREEKTQAVKAIFSVFLPGFDITIEGFQLLESESGYCVISPAARNPGPLKRRTVYLFRGSDFERRLTEMAVERLRQIEAKKAA